MFISALFFYYIICIKLQKHGTTSKPLKAVRLDSDEQAKIAKSGLEMKMMSSEMDAETDKWQGAAADENNDIVKRSTNTFKIKNVTIILYSPLSLLRVSKIWLKLFIKL